MRALITGGAGFIGGHLAERCLAAGHEVVILDDLSSGSEENVPCGADFLPGDVTDPQAVGSAAQGCDVVFHLAACRSVPRSVEEPLLTDRVNTGGTLTVLRTAAEAGVARVLIASSSSVYGGLAPLPTPETAPLSPRSPYAVSKVAADHYGRIFTDLYGMETVVLRFFNVFGPRQRPNDPYAGVIPRFLAALLTGERPVVYGDGQQSRDFTFVSDAVEAAMQAWQAPAEAVSGRAFNIARGEETTILKVLELLAHRFGAVPEPEFVDPRPGDVRHSRADITAAATAFGYHPEVEVAAGLARVAEWYADWCAS